MTPTDALKAFNLLSPVQVPEDRFTELMFGKKVPLDFYNIKEKYQTQLKLFELAVSDGFVDKKIYAYYIFALIIANQNLLLKISEEFNNDYNVEYYKNTFPEWELAIKEINDDLDNTLIRFLCYETFFKQIFNIKYDEKDFDAIREKIVPWMDLSETQTAQFVTLLFNPLFNGFFDFDKKNILVIKCIEMVCETFMVEKFPFPLFDTSPDREYKNHNSSFFDCVRPWVIYNSVINKRNLGQELLNSWSGVMDITIKQFTGINKGYTIKYGKGAGESYDKVKNTAGDFINQMKKEFQDLKDSLSNTYQGTKDSFDSFITAITYGGLALGGYLVYDLFTSNDRN
jgi:hypothetical protein